MWNQCGLNNGLALIDLVDKKEWERILKEDLDDSYVEGFLDAVIACKKWDVKWTR
jgi:hypothetical protein